MNKTTVTINIGVYEATFSIATDSADAEDLARITKFIQAAQSIIHEGNA